MKLVFSERAWEDYLYWQETDRRLVSRIHQLLQTIQREPYKGVGKPEPLKHAFQGYWSRRINDEHRIVYRIQGDSVLVAQLRYHY